MTSESHASAPDGERLLHLNLFMRLYGHHPSAWQRPGASADAAFDPDWFADLAMTCERGLFDAVFLADSQQAIYQRADVSTASLFEPLTLLSYIAAKTSRIGLIGTVSSTLHHPVNVARSMASLHLLSRGRAGINLVTSQSDAEPRLHGMPGLPDPDARYGRAREFAELLFDLWDTYPQSAILMDKVDEVFIDEAALGRIEHSGQNFRVSGTLNVPQTSAGRPLLVQAGASPQGRDLAAQYAEAIYGIGSTIEDARDYYEDIKRRTVAHGRPESAITVLPGVVTVIGETHAEAVDKKRYLDSLKSLPKQLDTLSGYISMDCSHLDPNDVMPELPPIEEFAGPKGRYVMMQTLSVDDDGRRVTVGEMLGRISAGGGHFTCVGTADEIADELVRWFDGRAADGFNINASTLPEGIEEFVDLVVPALQERGVYRTEYTSETIRGHFTQTKEFVR
ncbi:NtaA/DmoA family FMN-dependent monooxygenase [Microbacterium sp. SLBN-146]|uniref:NtaA/DmoA family FMN-dependent monooxygenase n=1 Tax=Microbacterium sp. SLBN-146 TaxID=2768457 RepID=UPI001152C19C|nr:NtaA/DmoA family FMN-dependent monooxygenase [Microbacterium sp. SLBN-146]TQJ29995.1 FMN-dependent oxidoreductase (nitrilotriacetate monooxygenase family) [Microbacterium sp. SLBN-146]